MRQVRYVDRLLRLGRVRQDVDVVEDHIVGHRETGADRCLVVASQQRVKPAVGVVRRISDADSRTEVFLLRLWLVELEHSRNGCYRVDRLLLRTKGDLLVNVVESQVQRQVWFDAPVVLTKDKEYLLVAVVWRQTDVALSE